MPLSSIILAVVFTTSLISGVFGMAGGMILMAFLTLVLSVPAAMMLHGAVQAMANGSRAMFLRSHIQWRFLPLYLVGSALAVSVFAVATWVPSPELVLLLIGVFPWLALALPKTSPVVITNPASRVLCGVVVTSAQLLAGASGPLLDLFYVNADLDRHEIVATKAITQVIGHLFKLAYYGTLFGLAATVPAWLVGAALLSSLLATRVGTWLLQHFSNEGFRRYSKWLILALGAACIVRAVSGWW